MKNRITQVLLIAVVVIIAALSIVFWPNGEESGNKVVRFGSFSVAVDYAPYLVAKNQKWFEEALLDDGYTAEYTVFQSLPPINESLATGRVDVVFEAEPPAIVGKAAGIDVKIVGLSCSLVQEILVPTESKVQSLADLKGNKIAVLAGTSSHYGLLKIIQQAGLKPSDVEVIDMIPPDAKNAFETDQVGAWAVWPPFVEQQEIAGKGRVLSGGDAVIHSIMAVRGAFAQNHPTLVKELLGVLQRAKLWIQTNPDNAMKIIAEELNISLDVVKKAWPRHDWSSQVTETIITDIQAKADFLSNNNFIRNKVNVQDLIDSSFETN